MVNDFRIREHVLHALQQGGVRTLRLCFVRVIHGMGEVGPVAVLSTDVIRIGTNDGNFLGTLQGQHAVVPQQHQTFPGSIQCQGTVLLAADASLPAGLFRLIQQAKLRLHRQDVHHGGVYMLYGQTTVLAGGHGGLVEFLGAHHHVVAGLSSLDGGILHVGTHVLVGHQTAHIVPVRDHKAVKAQLVTKHLFHGLLVEGQGCAVQGAVSGHDRGAVGFRRLFEGGQENFPYLPHGDFRVAGIPCAHGFTVGNVMLGAGQNAFRVIQLIPLEALNHGSTHFTGQVGILTEGFVHTSPPGIPGKAKHRGKGPVQAVFRHFLGGGTADFFRQLRIKAACHGQLGGENGSIPVQAVAVHRINAEQHGNPQPGVAGNVLQFPCIVPQDVQEGTYPQLCPFQRLFTGASGIGNLGHLGNLFLNGHLG